MLIDPATNIYINKEIAKCFGLRAAMILNRILWSINYHAENAERYPQYYAEGHWWMDDTAAALVGHFEGLISDKPLRDALKDMEALGLLISRNRRENAWDRTKSYAVSLDVYNKIITGQLTRTGRKGKLHPVKTTECDSVKTTDPIRLKQPNGTGENNRMTTISPTSPLTPSRTRNPPLSPADLDLGHRWLAHSIELMPHGPRTYASWTPEGFAREIVRLKAKTDLNDLGINAILQFLGSDEGKKFWRKNAVSPAALLGKSKSNGLRKIDNLLNELRDSKPVKDAEKNQRVQSALDRVMAMREQERA